MTLHDRQPTPVGRARRTVTATVAPQVESNLRRLRALGAEVWGTPLPHAEPFLVEWDGRTWHCHDWRGRG